MLKFLLNRKIEKYLINFRCFWRLGQGCSRYKIRLHVGTSRSRNVRIFASSIANRAHCSWNLGRDKNDRSFGNVRSENGTDLSFSESWNMFHRFSCLRRLESFLIAKYLKKSVWWDDIANVWHWCKSKIIFFQQQLSNIWEILFWGN